MIMPSKLLQVIHDFTVLHGYVTTRLCVLSSTQVPRYLVGTWVAGIKTGTYF